MNTTQTETGTETASTIIEQINHADFWARARWGVKQALALGPDARGVQFNCTKGIKIRIVLDASDTYSIEIGRLKGRFEYVKAEDISGVYADQLVKVIDAAFSGAFGRL